MPAATSANAQAPVSVILVDPNTGNPYAAGGAPAIASSAIAPGAMTAGQSFSTDVTVAGAAVGMAASCSPRTFPGAGFVWQAYVKSANTVTVVIVCVASGTPTSSIYDIKAST